MRGSKTGNETERDRMHAVETNSRRGGQARSGWKSGVVKEEILEIGKEK